MQSSILKFVMLIIMSTTLLFSAAAYADTNSTPENTGVPEGVFGSQGFDAEVKQSINSLTNGINDFTNSVSANMQGIGLNLLNYLAVIAIAFAGIQLALTSGSLSQPMNKLVTTIFTVGFAYYLLSPAGYDLFVKTGIDKSMDKLADLIMPGGSASVSDGFTNLLQVEFQLLFEAIDKFQFKGLLDILKFSGVVILLAFCMLAFMLLALLGMVAALSALISVAIALALGPIFIPFMVLERTEFLFDGWLKFTINACLTKVIVAVLIAIGVAAFTGITTGPGTSVGLLAQMLGAVVVAGTIAQMMLSAPQIASSLTSGGSTGGLKFGASAMRTLMKPGQNAAGAVGAAAGNALGKKFGNKIDPSSGAGSRAMQKLGQALRSNDFSANNTSRRATGAGEGSNTPPPRPGSK